MKKSSFSKIAHTEKKTFSKLNVKMTLLAAAMVAGGLVGFLLEPVFGMEESSKGVLPVICMLVVFLLEFVFILKPATNKVQNVLYELVESEFTANKYAAELNELNKSLAKTNKHIHDINFALDEATILVKTNRYGIITYANERYCAITKYSEEELIGEKLFLNRIGGEESVVYSHINNPEKTGLVWKGEVWDHAKDLTGFWLDVNLIPITDEEGELYQYLVICSNITPRKQAQDKLERITKERFETQLNEQKIRSLSIIAGQEKERKRMAREVHDGLGQMLTALKFSVESLNGRGVDSDRLGDIKDFLQKIIQEVRRISSDLLPSVLSDFGLVPALKEMVSSLNKNSNIMIDFEDQLDISQRLPKTYEMSLYRIAQEAINNALKYSEASQINVKLTNDVEFLNLTIKDDGRGFNPEQKMKSGIIKESGNGLKSMKERAELIEGNMLINSAPKKGTIIYIEVPLDFEELEYGNN